MRNKWTILLDNNYCSIYVPKRYEFDDEGWTGRWKIVHTDTPYDDNCEMFIEYRKTFNRKWWEKLIQRPPLIRTMWVSEKGFSFYLETLYDVIDETINECNMYAQEHKNEKARRFYCT